MSFSPADYQAMLAQLASLADGEYKKFNESLIPGTATAYGVRVPQLRQIAQAILQKDPGGFLAVSAPGSFEEIMIRGMVIARMKLPMAERLPLIESFLPLIDNWAVCDTFCSSLRPKGPQEKEQLWRFILPLFQDRREFYARFALVLFLGRFVEVPYVSQGLELLEDLDQEDYYIRMAAAWALSVCYIKFPQLTLPLLERQTLPAFTQNKAIQKIRESYRVPAKGKERLMALKMPPPPSGRPASRTRA